MGVRSYINRMIKNDVGTSPNLQMWHIKVHSLSFCSMAHMAKNGLLPNFARSFDVECQTSVAYVRGKLSKDKFNQHTNEAKNILRPIFSRLNKRQIKNGLRQNAQLINSMGETIAGYAKIMASK